MQRFTGKTVVVSGAGRGQGRSHALRFAREGANVVAFDICAPIDSQKFPTSTRADLDETVKLAEADHAKIIAAEADVRDADALRRVFADGVERFGGIDVVVANAGIVGTPSVFWETSEQVFRDVIDVDLIGVWNTVKAGVLAMIDGERRGAVVVTGSGGSVKGLPHIAPYVAAKHGLVGLVRTMAKELGPRGIRVNAVLPGNVNTAMFNNDDMRHLYVPDQPEPDEEVFLGRAASTIPMRVPYVQPEDVTEAVCYLASDAARYVTGTLLPVDAGSGIP
ncbi:MAG TPA: mycofactocin-coupled SDR family oxidoreductase [Amycolatopsis sp.]|nr:mycofactocin-coupled SDR family oxidoreductase [Amycolatopsis sp.]